MNKAIVQNDWPDNAPQAAQPAGKQPGILTIIKRQANEDPITFILTRLAGALIVINIVNQAGKLKGWW